MRRSGLFISFLCSLIAAGGLILILRGKAERTSEDVNVILIGIDALRADHLGCYGYKRNTSPSIDELARDSVLYENTMSQAPWTLPSVTSIFSSLYPSQHGVGITRYIQKSSLVTLAEILKKNGFTTAAFTGGAYVSRMFGFSRGFMLYEELNPAVKLKDEGGIILRHSFLLDVEKIIASATGWLSANADKKSFLFLYTYETHAPYFPPAKYDIFAPGYNGPITGDVWKDVGITNDINSRRKPLPPQDRERLISLYDGQILCTDDYIGKLIAFLKETNLYDKTMIVLTADHGEEFFDHGAWEHGDSLHQELLRVPLIIKYPFSRKKGIERERLAPSIDIVPTILDTLRIKMSYPMEGISLAKKAGGRVVFSQSTAPRALAVRKGDFKMIVDFDSSLIELYDLRRDPREANNLAGRKELLTPLFQEIPKCPGLDLTSPLPSLGKVVMDKSIRERLRSLGYLR